MLHLCIYHPVMARPLAEEVSTQIPDIQVTAIDRIDADPPDRDTIDALVAFRFRDGLLGRMPRLRWLQLTGTGYDHVARQVRPPSLIVTHAGSIPVHAVAEFVLMAILALARNAPTLIRQHDRQQWSKPGARLVRGKTLVILGLGRIGGEVAASARALGMRVIAVTRTGRAGVEVDHCVGAEQLGGVAAMADFMAVCVPGSASTQGLVGADVLAGIKPGCCLIDVSRPAVVDKDALVEALRAGVLRAAALDVHDPEPLPADHPLWRESGVWITPHCAFEQDDEVAMLGALIADNARRLISGRPLVNVARFE